MSKMDIRRQDSTLAGGLEFRRREPCDRDGVTVPEEEPPDRVHRIRLIVATGLHDSPRTPPLVPEAVRWDEEMEGVRAVAVTNNRDEKGACSRR